MRYGASLLALASLAFADPKVELGRRLFMDPTVSRSGKFSCSSCHEPEHGFSDPRVLSEDENGETRRHSQPLLDLAGKAFHWDGEFGSVRELLTARLAPSGDALAAARAVRSRHFEEAEGRGRGPDRDEFRKTIEGLTPPYYGPSAGTRPRAVPMAVERRLAFDHRYDAAFAEVFGVPQPTTGRIIDAIDAYVLSLRSGESAFDRYRAGDPAALTESQRRGLALFTGKADCVSCHVMDGPRPALTDHVCRNTGVAFRLAEIEFGGGLKLDGGAGEMTFVREDLGKFKTPSLRDVARRAPYMHDGRFATLEEVVRYYERGGTRNRYIHPLVRPLRLTDTEVSDLVAFLKALTSDERPGLGPVPSRSRKTRLRVVDPYGEPMRRFTVEVRPAGDRLRGASRAEPPELVTTDSKGYLNFEFPAWTHVRLLAPRHEIEYDWLIPDSVGQMTVMAAPRHEIALMVSGGTLPEKLVAHDPGHGLLFTRVRKIGPERAVYVTAKGGVQGAFLATFDDPAAGGVHEVDLSGGWTEPLDFRRE